MRSVTTRFLTLGRGELRREFAACGDAALRVQLARSIIVYKCVVEGHSSAIKWTDLLKVPRTVVDRAPTPTHGIRLAAMTPELYDRLSRTPHIQSLDICSVHMKCSLSLRGSLRA